MSSSAGWPARVQVHTTIPSLLHGPWESEFRQSWAHGKYLAMSCLLCLHFMEFFCLGLFFLFMFVWFWFWCFETGFSSVVLAVLHLLQTKLASNSQLSTYLCLPSPRPQACAATTPGVLFGLVPLDSPGCPGARSVDQAGLKLQRSTCLCLPSTGINNHCPAFKKKKSFWIVCVIHIF